MYFPSRIQRPGGATPMLLVLPEYPNRTSCTVSTEDMDALISAPDVPGCRRRRLPQLRPVKTAGIRLAPVGQRESPIKIIRCADSMIRSSHQCPLS